MMKSKGYAKGGMKTKGYAKGGMKQGYNDRLDDSMGARNGKKSQPMKARRNESRGMEKSMGNRANSGNKSSAQGYSKGGSVTGFTNMGTMKNHW
jgi:hypothetical protein|tara:strand:- start:1838 stop:2119 length:282 start_codon:yes stop_codon:yes gene_type:complete